MQREQLEKLLAANQKEQEVLRKEIGEAEEEIKRLAPELELEEKLFRKKFEDTTEHPDEEKTEMASQVKANVDVLKDLICMEQNKLTELERRMRLAELREQVIIS